MAVIRDIWRFHQGESPHAVTDELAEEEPLEIRVNNRAVSVTMRTPGHDDELAAGFLLTEGIIQRRKDLLRLETCPHDRGGNVLTATLAPGAAIDLSQLTRHVFASSSCGLCGKATIEAVHQRLEPIENKLMIDAQILLSLPTRLRDQQSAFDRTGGLHAAGLFTTEGELVVAREDVGRHNAVDKVLGYGLLNGLLPFDRHVLVVSGRSSFEIMQKALAGRVAIVAAVSAPSSLAVDFARESDQTLVGFLRPPTMNVYCNPERIVTKWALEWDRPRAIINRGEP